MKKIKIKTFLHEFYINEEFFLTRLLETFIEQTAETVQRNSDRFKLYRYTGINSKIRNNI